ncbi:MAG: hypothetical protein IKG96_01655 [Bacteroidaceae bacterium]|nr:hypothetical protein [Bacteroidaceae bacterium]
MDKHLRFSCRPSTEKSGAERSAKKFRPQTKKISSAVEWVSDCVPTVIRQKKNGRKSALTVKILRFSTENRLQRGWKSAVPTPETCYFTQNSRQELRGGNVKIRGIVNGCPALFSLVSSFALRRFRLSKESAGILTSIF